MKHAIKLIALAATLALAACTGLENGTPPVPELVYREFSASLSPETRTSLDGSSVLWDESGETISIVTTDGSLYTLAQKSASADRTTATFGGTVPEEGLEYAVYPALSSAEYESGMLKLTIPGEQQAVDGSFASRTNLAVSTVGDGEGLHFRNVGALLGITVNASGVTSVRLSATESSGGAMTGTSLLDFSSGVPSAVASQSGGTGYVELQGSLQSGRTYWAVIYPGTYTGLQAVFTRSDGSTATFKSLNTLTVQRSKAVSISAFDISECDWESAEDPGITATLTYSEASSYTAGYGSARSYTNSYGTWTICAYNAGNAFQLNKNKVAYIGTPDFGAVIKSVSITLLSGSGTSGNFLLCPSSGNTSAPSGSMSAACTGITTTIDASSLGLSQLWIRSDFYSRIVSITISTGSGATIPETPDTPSPGGGSGLADYGWFELPGQTDADLNGIDDNNSDLYYSHTMRADAPAIRNFSSCYSKGKIHPVWVAAPMHSCYKGSSKRNEAYGPDPNISCAQAAKWTGYTRGHMLGSSDRTVSVATNEQVFYYSNIGAQLSDGFNTGGGAWNNLESLTDGQWCSDTLYQVIGCIFTTFTDKYGKTVYPASVAGSSIPTAWYKVLLRTKAGNSGKRVDACSADELKCAAFILAHRSNAGHSPSASDMYTVSQLEELTGLTFFVNVPNAPKDTAVASEWGL